MYLIYNFVDIQASLSGSDLLCEGLLHQRAYRSADKISLIFILFPEIYYHCHHNLILFWCCDICVSNETVSKSNVDFKLTGTIEPPTHAIWKEALMQAGVGGEGVLFPGITLRDIWLAFWGIRAGCWPLFNNKTEKQRVSHKSAKKKTPKHKQRITRSERLTHNFCLTVSQHQTATNTRTYWVLVVIVLYY